MAFWKEKVDRILESLPYRTYHGFMDLEICGPVGYKTDNSFPTEGWSSYDGRMISGDDDHYWFRTNFKTPEAKEGIRYMLLITCGKENQGDATNPQGILYLNGKMVQGIDTHHYYVYLEPDTDYELYHYVYLALNQSSINQNMRIVEFDESTEKLFYDIQVAHNALKTMDENSQEYNIIMPYIEQAVNCLDFRELYSNEFYDGIKAAQEIMDKFYNEVCSPENKPVVACIGHTHIDVEWLWDRAQTREKIQRSFGNANELMKVYPEYKFMLSQPELYQYLKEEAPEKYEELKQLVKEGRWEAEGSMFVEADTNITSGEGLIRQIAHGKKFFKEEFGVDNHILFLPDVFGYTGALPQILQKSGVDRFVTSKISWNDTNTMPLDTFMWKGIDGTEIFSHFITCQNYTPNPARYTTYVGQINPTQVKGCYHRYKQKAYSNEVLLTYGFGDGGGGPTAEMIENYRRLEKGLPGMPVAKLDTLHNHIERVKAQFDESCKKLKKTPKWIGEMYLEFHRGTYTSAASVKRGNRKSEFGLQRAEVLSFTDLYLGGSYDKEGINNAWEKVLHNHFHDILPGSSIASVYEGTDKDYAELEVNELVVGNLDLGKAAYLGRLVARKAALHRALRGNAKQELRVVQHVRVLVVVKVDGHGLGHADLVGREARGILQGLQGVDKVLRNSDVFRRCQRATLRQYRLVFYQFTNHVFVLSYNSAQKDSALCCVCRGRGSTAGACSAGQRGRWVGDVSCKK